MTFRRLATLIFLLGVLCSAQAWSANIVTLSPRASVTGDNVELGEVAGISGEDAARLKKLVLQRVPAGSVAVGIGADFVRSRLAGAGIQARVNGSEQVIVQRLLNEMSHAELVRLYREAVLARNPWKGAEVSVDRIQAPQVLRIPAGERVAANFASDEDFLGLTTMTLSWGTPVRRARISGRVQVLAEVPVVSRSVKRGTILGPGDLEMARVDLSSTPGIVMSIRECVGKRAKTSLRRGRPVSARSIEVPPLINRGELVVIEACGKNLRITDRGVALKDGCTGDMIPVRNVQSGRQVVGTVIAHGQVRVVF